MTFVEQFSKVIDQYTPDLLVQMLSADNWRPPKVAAWVVGIQKIEQIRSMLETKLLSMQPHPEHLVGGLFLFGDETAYDVLVQYLNRIFDEYDCPAEALNLERVDRDSASSALAAIEVLGGRIGKGTAVDFLKPDGRWAIRRTRFFDALEQQRGKGGPSLRQIYQSRFMHGKQVMYLQRAEEILAPLKA